MGTKCSYYFDIFRFQSENETNLGISDRSNFEFFTFKVPVIDGMTENLNVINSSI